MANEIVREIESILLSNRNILRRNYSECKVNILKTELLESGFDFSHNTNKMQHQGTDQVLEFCYDFGLMKLKGDLYEIINIHNLMNTRSVVKRS